MKLICKTQLFRRLLFLSNRMLKKISPSATQKNGQPKRDHFVRPQCMLGSIMKSENANFGQDEKLTKNKFPIQCGFCLHAKCLKRSHKIFLTLNRWLDRTILQLQVHAKLSAKIQTVQLCCLKICFGGVSTSLLLTVFKDTIKTAQVN